MMDVSSAETRTAHRKRQKVFVACAPCRRKKVKCDAVHPSKYLLEARVKVCHF